MKFIGSMTRKINPGETVTVPAGEFWRGTIYGTADINAGTSAKDLSGVTLASGDTVSIRSGVSYSAVLSVLKFSEV